MMFSLILAAGLTVAAPLAYAATPNIERATGVVQSISDSAITLMEAGGKVETIKLTPS